MISSTLSYVRGADTPPLLRFTVGEALDLAAEQWGDMDALVSVQQGIRLSWSVLRNKADAMAAGLVALGLRQGERLGIWSPNCAEWTITQFAAAKAGLNLVNLNPSYRSSEIAFALSKCGVAALVCPERFRTSEYLAMVSELARSDELPHLRHRILIGGISPGWIGWDDVPRMATKTSREIVSNLKIECNDAANVQFTSGTTGTPKGATLSHFNIVNNGFFVGRATGLTAGDRLCIPVPLYHCFGMVMGNLACVTHGVTMVYPSDGFEPGKVLESVESERCTALYGVPTMFIAELADPDFERFDLSSLRTGIMAGSPCPEEVMRAVIDRMYMRDVTIAYGMTETSPVSFQNEVDDPVDRRVSTVGRIQPHLESKIVDAEGEIVPLGQAGELCTRGYAVMIGYWDEPETTTEVLDSDGWMHSGDLAEIDKDGYCRIVGRIKDMIIRGGENIYPRELEELLYHHPAVADVSVIGLPDAKYGEEVCACVILKHGAFANEEDIRDFCGSRIAHYKVPRYVRFVSDFPLTVSGKVQKFRMREQIAEELALV